MGQGPEGNTLQGYMDGLRPHDVIVEIFLLVMKETFHTPGGGGGMQYCIRGGRAGPATDLSPKWTNR